MSITAERPAARRGRRKSDRAPRAAAPLPVWLDAPLCASGEPVDGEWGAASGVRPNDFLFEFHESDRSASWLRVLSVAVVEGSTLITHGRGDGVTVPFAAGRSVWVLRSADAVRLADAASDRVLRAWGEPEQSMQGFLRRYASAADLVRQWPFPDVAVADAVAVWELLRLADEANGLGAGVAA